jgi:hypothetical protein
VSALALYGVGRNADAPALPEQLRGPRGEALRPLPMGPLLLIASEVDSPPALDEGALRAHDAAARALHALLPAFLPARFGSAAESEQALLRAFEPLARLLDEALSLVHGREQMTLRVFGESQDAPASAALAQTAADDAAGPGPGARYLTRLAHAHARAREVPELVLLRPFLRDFVRAEHAERAVGAAPAAPGLLASVFHLIDRGSADAYAQALEAGLAAGRASLGGLRFSLSGPWPAWSFAPEVLP